MLLMVSGPPRKYIGHPYLGWLLNPRAGASIQTIEASGLPWAADNDCFKQLHRAAYIRMLRRISGRARLQWVVAPDVVANATATLARWSLWLPVLRYYGVPAAFVAQDGQEDLPLPWDDMACLFIGGSTAWKLSMHAVRLIEEAARRGKWVHVGRVSTEKRIAHFDSLPVTSIDTTAASRARRILVSTLERLQHQQHGFLHAA